MASVHGAAVKFGQGRSAVEVNIASATRLFQVIRDRFARKEGFALATLNLDHLTKLPVDQAFADAYRAHDLVVADGRPVVWLSRLARRPVALMPGSDLVIPLCNTAAEMDVPVALIGSTQDALEGAQAALQQSVPGLVVSYIHAPAFGFDPVSDAAGAICDALDASGARLCFIALGAPKQEIFAAFARGRCPQVGFASVGAGLDFLSGHQVRAPRIMRAVSLEWFWRALQSPRRMVPRYARCFAILPRLTVQALRQR
ncbi:WecB/TagA/CpsF family glycosyltransferase [Sulfitobacter sp. HNIBRBA3233]|uniref:WecB/TagA/CpsF family glycosyltransferase n=1 Tax=Sulfitobacter marinivivus TaxID=3158558 RepID=UPI0032DF6FEB